MDTVFKGTNLNHNYIWGNPWQNFFMITPGSSEWHAPSDMDPKKRKQLVIAKVFLMEKGKKQSNWKIAKISTR